MRTLVHIGMTATTKIHGGLREHLFVVGTVRFMTRCAVLARVCGVEASDFLGKVAKMAFGAEVFLFGCQKRSAIGSVRIMAVDA